jgi:thiamine biosynthesis lipoprotein
MRELSRIVSQEVRDPAVADLRVSKVDLSPDKRHARVLVAFWDPKVGEAPDPRPLEALERATPFIRKALARSLRMRHVPELQFSYDLAEEHTKRIETLLTRIHKRAKKKGMAVVFAAIASQSLAPPSALALERLESSAAIMGSEFRIACYAETKKLAAGAVTAAFDEVRRVDALLSNYKQDSELSRINREAGHGDVQVSEEMAALLDRCLRYSDASEGAFDITVGALVKAWGFYDGEGSMPRPWTLWWAKRNSGFQHLHVDRAKGTVRFLRAGLQLDPGGIGKGYAVDRAVAALREYGVERALVSSGTSSIYALGTPPDSAGGWDLNLRGADAADSEFLTVTLRDESLSTSGSYEKFFEEDGTRYGHILDPRTGRPALGMAAVSVIGPSAIDTEAWSTAMYVNGAEWAREHGLPQARVLLCPQDAPCGWLAGQ